MGLRPDIVSASNLMQHYKITSQLQEANTPLPFHGEDQINQYKLDKPELCISNMYHMLPHLP